MRNAAFVCRIDNRIQKILCNYTATIIRIKLCEHCCVISSTSSRGSLFNNIHFAIGQYLLGRGTKNFTFGKLNWGGEFLDKMRCCVGGRVLKSNLVLSTELIRKFATVKSLEADASGLRPSSELRRRANARKVTF